MKKGALEEQILRASKEVVVKFIEAGRLSPTGFAETFKSIYRSIDETVKETRDLDWGDADSHPQSKS
ncbi:MAG: hypothetical protein P8X96_20270 [Desulfobacteraceae bacterium]|jgi:hypothetical protein